MDRTGIRASYAWALLWGAAFVGLAMSANLLTELVLVDFIHGNHNRPQSNALTMMVLYPPILSIIAIMGVGLIFGPAQLLQAGATYLLGPKYGRRAFLSGAMLLPMAATLTWYCFDYLTPSDVGLAINEGPDWVPYQHGISPLRFLEATGAQVAVTTFTLAYCATGYWPKFRRPLLLGMCIVVILGGSLWGYRGAKIQYEFIDHPSMMKADG